MKTSNPLYKNLKMWLVLSIILVTSLVGTLIFHLKIRTYKISVPETTVINTFSGSIKYDVLNITLYNNDIIEGYDVRRLSSSLKEQCASIGVVDGNPKVCYSSEYSAFATNDARSSSLNVSIVEGDFFLIHPLKLKYGCYINDDAAFTSGCVIDEMAAWNLFGATNVVGFTFYIDEKPFIVTGVVAYEPEGNMGQFYGKTPRAYVTADSQFARDSYPVYSNISLLLPEATNGAAIKLAETIISNYTSNYVVHDVLHAFDFGTLRARLKALPMLTVTDEKNIKYAPWNNYIEMLTTKGAICLFFEMIFAGVSALIIIFSIALTWQPFMDLIFGSFKKLIKKIRRY